MLFEDLNGHSRVRRWRILCFLGFFAVGVLSQFAIFGEPLIGVLPLGRIRLIEVGSFRVSGGPSLDQILLNAIYFQLRGHLMLLRPDAKTGL